MIAGAHLVGSVPLGDAETVFRMVTAVLGPYLTRLPDGETGARKNWIAWQYGVLAATPGLEPMAAGDRGYLRRQLVRCVAPPQFGSLGYAAAARASFAVFDHLQHEGVIPRRVRFQVSLPTPLAPITVFVEQADRARVEPAYEEAMLAEVAAIAAAVPHDRLSIQWDLAVEVGLLERAFPSHVDDDGIGERLCRIARAVPTDVELGFHLCYGDFGHRHFMNPGDASTLVRLANTLPRPIDFLHLPVPITWTERAAYEPLSSLVLDADVYLGVVHMTDGLAGARKRIAFAAEQLPRFGIATECGWGRRESETVPALLELHASILRGAQ